LINNILLVIMTVTVLLGTLYPLILDSLGLGKISVGPPYFNALFVPLMVVTSIFMGLGPVARWKRMAAKELYTKLWLAGVVAFVLGALIPVFYGPEWNVWVALGMLMALWIVLPLVRDIWDKTRNARSFGAGLKKLSLTYWGMVLGHLGVAFTIVGVAVVSHYSVERNVRMGPGDSVEVAGYHFTMTALSNRRGPNFLADTAEIDVQRGESGRRFTMQPEKRLYLATGMPMTQVALRPGFFRDLYVAMGEDLGDGSWAMRIQHKPLVRWLWLGGLLMAAGGLLAVADKRYRRRRARQETHDKSADASSSDSPSQEALA
jgi:cytochrome c-type biogenesis protein CcmF